MTHYSRAAIGLRPSRGGTLLTPARVKGIALHWPAMSQRRNGLAEVAPLLRNIQTAHMDTDQIADGGASDIAYQYAIDQSGNTYRLRGLRHRSGANGDTDVNEEYGALLLILAIGEPPTEQLIRAVSRRVTRHRDIFPRSRLIVPHSAIRPAPTDCPGDRVRKLIEDDRFGKAGS